MDIWPDIQQCKEDWYAIPFLQAAVSAKKLDEDSVMLQPNFNLSQHLKRSELDELISQPVEIVAFSEEEGIRL